MPGDSEAVAGVISGAGNDGDTGAGGLGQFLPGQMGQAPRGILHEHNSRDAVVINCPAVNFSQLISTEDKFLGHDKKLCLFDGDLGVSVYQRVRGVFLQQRLRSCPV